MPLIYSDFMVHRDRIDPKYNRYIDVIKTLDVEHMSILQADIMGNMIMNHLLPKKYFSLITLYRFKSERHRNELIITDPNASILIPRPLTSEYTVFNVNPDANNDDIPENLLIDHHRIFKRDLYIRLFNEPLNITYDVVTVPNGEEDEVHFIKTIDRE